MTSEQLPQLNRIIGSRLFDVTMEDDELQLTFEHETEQTFLYVSLDNLMIVRRSDQPIDDNQLTLLDTLDTLKEENKKLKADVQEMSMLSKDELHELYRTGRVMANEEFDSVQ